MPEVRVQNSSVNIPTYLVPILMTGFVILMTTWVGTVASDQAKSMDEAHKAQSDSRFSTMETEVRGNATQLAILENNLENISDEVSDAKQMATDNHDLLTRIATKLEVEGY